MLISTQHHHRSKNLRIFLICYLMLLVKIIAKEIVVLGQPTDQERSWIGITQQLFDYISYEKVIGGEQYECRTMLKANLSSNKIGKVYPLHTTLKTPRQSEEGELLVEERTNDQKSKLVKRVDKVLDLLSGHCTYYQSDTFIYEYCHKQHIRQFDSQITKLLNSKAFFEDISMGVYNPEKRNAHSEHETTPIQKTDLLPQYSDFREQYSIITPGFAHNEGILQFQESKDGNLMYMSYHMLQRGNHIIIETPIFVQLVCRTDTQSEQFSNYGLLVDPYIILYTAYSGACNIVQYYSIANIDAQFMGGEGFEELRVYGRYLFGKVQEKCSLPKFWNSQNGIKGSFDYEGRLMKITYTQQSQLQQQILVTIYKVHTSDLFQFQEEIGTSIKYNKQQPQAEGSPHLLKISSIQSCQILFQRPAQSKQPLQIRFIGNSLIQSKDTIQIGQYFGCVGSVSLEGFTLSQNQLQIFIVKQIWDNYYQAMFSMKGRKLTEGEQILSEYIQKFTCYKLRQQQNRQITSNIEEQQKTETFMNFHRITPTNNLFTFSQNPQSFLYMLNIGQIGLLKLTTHNKQNISFTYLISSSKMVKTRQDSGMSLQLTQQNHYYQNETSSNGIIFSDYIYIRMGKLSNGSSVAGLWKMQDDVAFPRLVFFDETFLSLQRIHGSADIRSINLDKVDHQQFFATQKWLASLQQHFKYEDPLKNDNNLFLQESYSLSYLYVNGDYCTAPISKHRFTNVTLKCGPSYLQIKQISQPNPCEYSIQVQTSLLCKDGQTFTVQKEEDLSTNVDIRRILSAGVICFPAEDTIWKRSYILQESQDLQQIEVVQVVVD